MDEPRLEWEDRRELEGGVPGWVDLICVVEYLRVVDELRRLIVLASSTSSSSSTWSSESGSSGGREPRRMPWTCSRISRSRMSARTGSSSSIPIGLVGLVLVEVDAASSSDPYRGSGSGSSRAV